MNAKEAKWQETDASEAKWQAADISAGPRVTKSMPVHGTIGEKGPDP